MRLFGIRIECLFVCCNEAGFEFRQKINIIFPELFSLHEMVLLILRTILVVASPDAAHLDETRYETVKYEGKENILIVLRIVLVWK